jgi:TetR/AcrR family transcriptional regulator
MQLLSIVRKVFKLSKKINYHALIGEGNPLLRYPRLQEAAINEFSMKKYEDASLNDILKNAGMSKGSFYHHFGDKFGLYLSMMGIIVRKKLSCFYPLIQEKTDSSDFFASLKDIMKSTMDFMLADERMHHFLNRVMEESVEFRNRLYDFFPYDYSRPFYEYISQAVKSGQINSSYPAELVAGIIEIMFSNLHKLINAGDPDELINIASQVVDILQYGISGRQALNL